VRIFTYVQVYDAGGAPNYDAPAVTLAVCKPRVRMTAQPGDVVLGFAGRRLGPDPHGVRWAGVVAEKLPFATYWSDPRFKRKKPHASATPDNIYRPLGGELIQVPNTTHGPRNVRTDTGGRFVLVFDPCWRFGDSAPAMPARFGLRMTAGRRGHRVSELSADTWCELRTWLDGSGHEGRSQPAAAAAQTERKEPRRAARCR
jgi:hypothetical protein